jgi:hypothetical protein
MLSRMLSTMTRLRFTLGYAALLGRVARTSSLAIVRQIIVRL